MDIVIAESFHNGNCRNYYFNVLRDIDNKEKVRSIDIDIDRGVYSFLQLSNVINKNFPNLEKLTIRQNYCTGRDTVKDFVNFCKKINVTSLIIIDSQSEIFKNIEPDMLRSINKHIKILSDNYDQDEDWDELYHVSIELNALL